MEQYTCLHSQAYLQEATRGNVLLSLSLFPIPAISSFIVYAWLQEVCACVISRDNLYLSKLVGFKEVG